jgi:hypothetical protein
MKTQLRVVVEGFLVLPVVVFSVNDVYKASYITLKACKSYLTFLCNDGVLVCDNCMYRNGPNASEYLSQQPKTKLGGNSRKYLSIRRLRRDKPPSKWTDRHKVRLLRKMSPVNSGT